jgi:hypothetical protein
VSRKETAVKKSKTPVAVTTTKRVVVSGKTPRKMPKAAAVRADLRKQEKEAKTRKSKLVDDEAEEDEEEEKAPKKTKKRAAADEEDEENESPKRARKSEEKPRAKKAKSGADEAEEDGDATADEGEAKKERAKPRFKKRTMHLREMKFLQEIPNEKFIKSKTAHRRARRVADGDYRFTRDAVARISEIAVGMCKLDMCRARALNQFVSIHDGTGLSNPGPLRPSALSMAHLLSPY